MPLQDAFNLIDDLRRQPALRFGAYECRSPQEFRGYLKDQGYRFEPWEFEDAATNKALRCQEEWEIQEIHDIKNWYHMLSGEVSGFPD